MPRSYDRWLDPPEDRILQCERCGLSFPEDQGFWVRKGTAFVVDLWVCETCVTDDELKEQG